MGDAEVVILVRVLQRNHHSLPSPIYLSIYHLSIIYLWISFKELAHAVEKLTSLTFCMVTQQAVNSGKGKKLREETPDVLWYFGFFGHAHSM